MTLEMTPHRALIKRWASLQKVADAVTEARPSRVVSKAMVQGWWNSGFIPSPHHSAVLYAGRALKPKIKHRDFFEVPEAKELAGQPASRASEAPSVRQPAEE